MTTSDYGVTPFTVEDESRDGKKSAVKNRVGTHAARVISSWRNDVEPAFTREALSARLGTSVSTVVRWENPRMSNPRLSELWAMESLKPGLIGALFGEKQVAFTVPAKTVSEANVRTHWAARAKRTKTLRSSAKLQTLAAIQAQLGRSMTPKRILDSAEPTRAVEISMTRLAPGILDDDNLAGALKGFRDGMADAFGLDDRDPSLRWKYDQRRSKTYAVEVVVRWTPKLLAE